MKINVSSRADRGTFKQVEVGIGPWKPTPIRRVGISAQTFYRWKKNTAD